MQLLSTFAIVLLTLLNLVYQARLEEAPQKIYFQAPTIPENAYLASFIEKNDLNTKFIVSKAKKDGVDKDLAQYDGEWRIEVPESSVLIDDYTLVLGSKAKHHAIATKLNKPLKFDSQQVIIQYEVKFQNGMECGGAYIKLLSSHGDTDLSKFFDKTPFTIMFGPDKCGNDQKLHFIFRHQNPVSGVYEEKSIKTPYRSLEKVFSDHLTHLFTLILRNDNTFEIYVDQSLVTSGNLLESFDPPVNPPSEIADPNDKKPAEWDDREKIPDPSAFKPIDWDENAPELITDPDSSKPEGWLDNEPTMIPDPMAKKPDDWDVEIDGEWEAPSIDNPVCASAPGCGQWTAPQIKNPAFKGKWSPPMISNPEYKGVWKARIIKNPHFFEDKNPYKMSEVHAVGLELWSMTDGVTFDNFLIVDKKEAADKWTEETWSIKHKAEVLSDPSAQSVVDFFKDQMEQRPAVVIAIAITSIFFFVIICYLLCFRSSTRHSDEQSRHKKDDDYTANDFEENEENTDNSTKYPAAGPVLKKNKSVTSEISRSRTPSPAAGLDGDSSPETPEDEDTESSKSPVSKEMKVKQRRARKD